MFQTYEAPEPGQRGNDRVGRLRELMARAKLDAVLVPRADQHQGEYVPPCAERLAWLTGFTGSAGLAVVARSAAALFVDGRYVAQAPSQVDARLFKILQVPKQKPSDWLRAVLAPEAVVGFDPWLHTATFIEDLGSALEPARIRLKPLNRNLVDRIWGRARPPAPSAPVVPHPLKYAGKPASQKIADVQGFLREHSQDAVVLTLPDSIAWLFNIRGADVAHNPVPLAFAIVPATGKPELFLDPEKVGAETKAHLAGVARVSKPATLEERISALARSGKRVRLDPATAAFWFFRKLRGGKTRIARAADPCLLPKARKNAAEIKGSRAAHKRDGVAMTRFLAWLDREAASGTVDEIMASERLEMMRSETQALKEISFDTISGAGPNGAIVHYRVTTATNRKLRLGELYLVDSGAQYLDGTTDVTRTVAIGKPTQEMRSRFSLVLKAHIAVATARFPQGARGVDLDPLARRAMWRAGLDFDHGTGHGVGSYLSVHEGPQSISARGMVPLEPGMIISNEPGYYKQGAYGIRIENLVLVTEPEAIEGGERDMLGFETLTLVPIDRRLVVAEMLSPEELAWLNAYHQRVRETIGPELGPEDREWLEKATLPLA
ncbi:MAG TPA: aminopeptidase P family protein [Hyphomicrobiaceae bacterium]|nr:aminopeptidase P family protein [Hyphomicrobiaceae bacterium]